MLQTLSRGVVLLLIVLVVACSEQPAPSGSQTVDKPATAATADLVLTNATIYTVDAKRSVAKALAIRANRIIAVGSAEEISKHIGEKTQVRDVQGRMIMPGIHDSHIHAIGTVEPDMCDLKSQGRTLEEMVPFLRECLQRYDVAAGEWLPVVQWPFALGNQPSERYPNLRAALDGASTEHPIILWGDDGHHGAANSAALALARDSDGKVIGINRETLAAVFADSREHVAVDEHGEPSGGINEGARLLIRPEFNQDMMGVGADPAEVMPRVAAQLASRGITTIHDPYSVAGSLEMYQWLEDNEQMTFRLRAGLYHEGSSVAGIADGISAFEQLREKYQNSRYIRADGVKLFADAVLEGNPFTNPPTLPVAAMLKGFKQPIFKLDKQAGTVDISGYVDLASDVCLAVRAATDEYAGSAAIESFKAEHGYLPAQCLKGSGVLEYSEEYIHEFVRQATAAGFHVHIHALADRGVRVAVDALEKVKDLSDQQGLTQSLAHVQIAHPDDQRRIGALGLYIAFTYVWMTPDPVYNMMVIPFIEEVRGVDELFNPDTYYMQNVYPVKAIKDFGGILTFGSDAPVDTRDPIPFVSMQQAVTRAYGDAVLNAQQRIDIHDAIEAYTINGARLFKHEKDLGSIEAGKIADLIVLDRNLVELAEQGNADKIAETQVVLTVFDGRVVYERKAP